jgi:SagB-type dehydrogenase family enzyme
MTGNRGSIRCRQLSKAFGKNRKVSKQYWLSESILIELEATGAINVVVPSARQRLRVGISVVPLLCEIVRQNQEGNGVSLADLGDGPETKALLDQLIFFGVLSDAKSQCLSSRDMLTLLERSTLRMSQMGGCYEPELPTGVKAPPRFVPLRPNGPVISLPQPELPGGVTLWEAIAARRSRRDGPLRQLSMAQLSAMLSCTLKIQVVAEDKFGEISFRPTASGGARHPIDAFVIPIRVDSLPLGFYEYDPVHHGLILVEAPSEAPDVLCRLALSTMVNAPNASPAIILVFAAVPARTACKYEQSALVTVMKDTGCLIQQCYLVAQGLGLVGCAVGGSDHGVVETLLRLNDSGHSFVGGFVLW